MMPSNEYYLSEESHVRVFAVQSTKDSTVGATSFETKKAKDPSKLLLTCVYPSNIASRWLIPYQKHQLSLFSTLKDKKLWRGDLGSGLDNDGFNKLFAEKMFMAGSYIDIRNIRKIRGYDKKYLYGRLKRLGIIVHCLKFRKKETYEVIPIEWQRVVLRLLDDIDIKEGSRLFYTKDIDDVEYFYIFLRNSGKVIKKQGCILSNLETTVLITPKQYSTLRHISLDLVYQRIQDRLLVSFDIDGILLVATYIKGF